MLKSAIGISAVISAVLLSVMFAAWVWNLVEKNRRDKRRKAIEQAYLVEQNTNHRWSGWPGAWCLDCGINDQFEQAIADNVYNPYEATWTDSKREKSCLAAMNSCPTPGSKRFDPYDKIVTVQ